MKKTFTDKLICAARNFRSRLLFRLLEKYCHGDVLDVGGWDFYLSVKDNPKINFSSWTNLEKDEESLFQIDDQRYRAVIGDGENMKFGDGVFDTVLNIQVLEHTFEPIKMVKEIGRVLKTGGYGVFLIPQTSVLHHPPHHYYNFTKFWIKKAVKSASLEIIDCRPLGGRWSSTASHLVHFFLQSLKSPRYSTSEDKRTLLFYLLYPFMAVYAAVSIPIFLIFSLGDLSEEANNHLVVVKKTENAK